LAAVAAIVLASAVPAWAQLKTDIVTLKNGDRITCEIKKLVRGRLEVETDDAGTIYIEWDKIAKIQAAGTFEVVTSEGRRVLGSLSASDRAVEVETASGSQSLPMYEVTGILPIGASFWARLEGSFDLGFNYTRSSKISQLNLNSNTLFRRPEFQVQLKATGTVTDNGDGTGRDDRGDVSMSYLRFVKQRAFVAATGSFETNESLGLVLRSQIAGVFGRHFVNTNRAFFAIGGGLSVNDERPVDVAPTQNLEGVVTLKTSFYTYDKPKTTIDATAQYYPGLTDWGRQRLQVDAAFKRDLVGDFYLSLSTFFTFDSRPANASANHGDVGFTVSFGWTY
jgi:Protein of unknown function, DUF481